MLFPTQFNNNVDDEGYTGAYNYHKVGTFTDITPIDIGSAYPTT